MTTIVNETVLLQKYDMNTQRQHHHHYRRHNHQYHRTNTNTKKNRNKMYEANKSHAETPECFQLYQWFEKHCINQITGTSCTHKYGWSKKLLSMASLNLICIVAEFDISTAVSDTQPEYYFDDADDDDGDDKTNGSPFFFPCQTSSCLFTFSSCRPRIIIKFAF